MNFEEVYSVCKVGLKIFHMLLRQIVVSIGSLKLSKDFILHHKIWQNWQSMRWLYTIFIILAIYLGMKMIGLVTKSISNLFDLISGNVENVKLAQIELPDFSFLSSDSYKYLFLFFTMSLVYHFGGRALEILYRIPYQPSWKNFLKTQVRTFGLLVICYVLENIFKSISSAALGLIDLEFLKPVLNFILASFFFGVVILDTLLDARGFTFKQAIKYSLDEYPMIALIYGMCGLTLSYIPVVGVFLIGSLLTVGILIATRRIDNLRQHKA